MTGALRSRPANDSGSVFVESIIAATIVAVALGATFQVIGDGANRDRAVQARRGALLVAQSRLAAVGSEIALRSARTDGQEGDLAWRVDVSPDSDGIDASAGGALWRVIVSVRPRAGGGELVRLDTLRLGPAAE
jgi:hypothetical protein